jgi:predicted TPR repeat methyltransferase
MRPFLRALLPAAALTFVVAPNGADEPPRHLGAALVEQRTLSSERPDDAGVWNDLGNLLVLRGDLDEAESAYARALELDPSSTAARFNLALLRQQRGDLEGAVADYRGLLEVDPDNAWAQYQLGAAYEAQGQRELAVAAYAAAFTLDRELLFAETNPHIIENRLVTEALLRAQRGSHSGPAAPRAYDDLGRITSILTPAPLAWDTATDRSAADEPADEGRPEPELTGEPSRGPAEGSNGHRGRGAGRSDSAALAAPTDRVLDPTDLRGGAPNQLQGGGGDPPGGGRRRAGVNVAPGGGRGSQLPTDEGANVFGLGQRSTGALEWRLGPVSGEPVPAGR